MEAESATILKLQLAKESKTDLSGKLCASFVFLIVFGSIIFCVWYGALTVASIIAAGGVAAPVIRAFMDKPQANKQENESKNETVRTLRKKK